MIDTQSIPHQIILDDRRRLAITGVSDVNNFDDNIIVAQTAIGELTIKGHGLQICRLNNDTGDLSVEGTVNSLEYAEVQRGRGGIFGKLFK